MMSLKKKIRQNIIFFNTPYPQATNLLYYFRRSILIGVQVFVILQFGFVTSQVRTFTLFNKVIISISISGVYLLHKFIWLRVLKWRNLNAEEDWKVYHHILHTLVIILNNCIIFYIIAQQVFGYTTFTSFKDQLQYYSPIFFYCSLMGLLYNLYEYHTRIKFFKAEASLINQLSPKESPILSAFEESLQEVIFHSDDDRVLLRIQPSQLYLIEAEGNYIMVYWYEIDGKLKKTLVRMSMSTAEKIVTPFSNFFRCHRSYIINMNELRKLTGNNITGNARGLMVKLAPLEMEIPIARNRIEAFKEKINFIRPKSKVEDK